MTTTKKINDGSVKLTKENITQGRLGEKIRSIVEVIKFFPKKN